MTRLELFNILRPIVLLITDVPECILANQNTTAPTGDYCSIEPFQNLQQLGRGSIEVEQIDAVDGNTDFKDRQETLTAYVEASVSVNFYRGNAQDYAHKLMFADQRVDVHDVLFAQGVGWMGTDPVNNLTSLNSGQYEPRSQITIRVRFKQTQQAISQQLYASGYEVYDENNNLLASGSTDD